MMPMTATDGLVAAVLVVVVFGLLYVFYPALSISQTRSEVTEKVVSGGSTSGKSDAELVTLKGLVVSPSMCIRYVRAVISQAMSYYQL